MNASFYLYPLEEEEEEDLDGYDDAFGDYCDQFNLPFLEKFADYIVFLNYAVNIRITMINEKGYVVYSCLSTSTSDNFLNNDDENQEKLWSFRHNSPLTVSVQINNSGKEP